MKKKYFIIFYLVSLKALYLDSLLSNETQNIVFKNVSETIILRLDHELHHNFFILNENTEKMRFEINNGSLSSNEKIHIFFRNVHFIINDNYINNGSVFRFSQIEALIFEVNQVSL